MSTPSKWQYFSLEELYCKGTDCCGGLAKMDNEFMALLVSVRRITGIVMNLSSGYRCPKHNAKVSKTGLTGPHTTGHAVDIKVSGANALKIIQIAGTLGMTGIGDKQHGPYKKRFLHLDDLPNAPGQPRPHKWTYK